MGRAKKLFKKLDPTGADFLGAGRTGGRILGNMFTGGAREFFRPDPFGFKRHTVAGKVGHGIGGAMQGGVGGFITGGPVGAVAGGAIGGVRSGLGQSQPYTLAGRGGGALGNFGIGAGSAAIAGGIAGGTGYGAYGGPAGSLFTRSTASAAGSPGDPSFFSPLHLTGGPENALQAAASSAPTKTSILSNLSSAIGSASKSFGAGSLLNLAGIGMLGAGLFGGRGPEIDEAFQAGDAERAQQIINELAEKERIAARELAAEQEAKRKAFLTDTRERLKQRRAESISKLQGRLSEQSRLELPSTLEDLQGRGLLNSETAVSQALAQKQAENALQVQQYEQEQSLADAAIEDQIAQEIINNTQGLEQAGFYNQLGLQQQALARRFGIEDASKNARIAAILAARQSAQNRNQSLIQSGGQFLGYGMIPRLLGIA